MLLTLPLLAHILAAAPVKDLPMPPPPPGMKLLSGGGKLVAQTDALQMPPPPPGMKVVAKDSADAGSALQMPPAPPGMKLLADDEKAKLEVPAKDSDDDVAMPVVTDTGDENNGEESEKESMELEELRALEDVTLDPGAKNSAEVLQSLRRLGFANPLRARMSDALEELELQNEPPGELGLVTDLSSFDVRQVAGDYDIPVEMQPLVAEYIHFFQGPGRKWFKNWMARSTRFIPVMQPILEAQGVPKDLVYLSMIESGFSPKAYSWAKASGPWQFISSTGKTYGLKQDFWVDERRDPLKATVAAARFLKTLYKDLGHWYLAWAGYNAGANKIRHTIEKKGTSDFWQISDGKGLAKETKHYVPKLIAAALVAKHPEAFGFGKDEIDYQPILTFDEVKLSAPTDMEVLARAAGCDVKTLEELNPELRHWCTPPVAPGKAYVLRVPKGTASIFEANFAKIPPQERLTFKSHVVKRGDTLSKIAQTYGSAPEAIMRLNQLTNAKYLKVNTALMIPIPSSKTAKEAALANQIARARRAGFNAVRPEDEIPAGSQQKTSNAALAGTVKTEKVDGKTKVTYGVASGDSLWTIAQRFNCAVDELRTWNMLPKQKRGLKVGQLLTIWPGPAAAPIKDSAPVVAKAQTAGPGGKTHQLAEGESLWSVSQKYGVSVDDLKKWNHISDNRTLKVGQQLTLVSP
ncbi:MAG: LysM peptidoglycan-binding domain-containing protein [Myxococcaceae bacterium]